MASGWLEFLSYSLYLCIIYHSNYLLNEPSHRLTESERIELKSFAIGSLLSSNCFIQG
jgi:hypothetical protein